MYLVQLYWFYQLYKSHLHIIYSHLKFYCHISGETVTFCRRGGRCGGIEQTVQYTLSMHKSTGLISVMHPFGQDIHLPVELVFRKLLEIEVNGGPGALCVGAVPVGGPPALSGCTGIGQWRPGEGLRCGLGCWATSLSACRRSKRLQRWHQLTLMPWQFGSQMRTTWLTLLVGKGRNGKDSPWGMSQQYRKDESVVPGRIPVFSTWSPWRVAGRNLDVWWCWASFQNI